jgi:7-cyano-7-deazaguanine synthase
MNESKALIMLSGGIDSATCLYWAKKNFTKVFAITFNYYDRVENEKKATVELAKRVDIERLLEINIPFIKEYSDRGMTDCNGHNCSHSQYSDYDERLSSYIPARNMIFYSIAAHYAEFSGIKRIIGGHNSVDAKFFKDATKGYIQKINSLFKQGCLIRNGGPCKILLPLADMDRKKIINLALELDVPLQITWSCHNNGDSQCGECYSCLQRLDAFKSLGIKDPMFS